METCPIQNAEPLAKSKCMEPVHARLLFLQATSVQERRVHDATWYWRFHAGRKKAQAKAVQRTAARLTSERGLQADPQRWQSDKCLQAFVGPSSNKGVQVIPVRNSLANPWCRSWLARMLRRSHRRYLTRAWCAWTHEYVQHRLAKALEKRLGSWLKKTRCRCVRKVVAVWRSQFLERRLLRAKLLVMGKAVSRLVEPGPLMLRAVMAAWRRRMSLQQGVLRAQGRLAWRGAVVRTQACFKTWAAVVRIASVERKAGNSQQSCRAAQNRLAKLHQRSLLASTWSCWRCRLAAISARLLLSKRWERQVPRQKAPVTLALFLGWKILLLSRAFFLARAAKVSWPQLLTMADR